MSKSVPAIRSVKARGVVVPLKRPLKNAFGVFDMLGNVGEWTEDFYHMNYLFAPNDGRAWLDDDLRHQYGRVVRGGAWNHDAAGIRSAKRAQAITVEPSESIGFRVARSL